MRTKLGALITLALLFSAVPSIIAKSAPVGDASLNSLLASANFRRVSLHNQPNSGLSFHVSINNKPASLIIATAAPISVLDRNSLYKFGISERKTDMTLSGTLGKTSEHVGFGKVKSVEFANIVLADFEAGAIDESVLNRTGPHTAHLDGVFGYSQMRKLGAVIDCGHRNLYVNPWGPKSDASAQLEKFLLNRGFVRIPMRFNSVGHPEVDCRVNHIAAKAAVETAAFNTVIDEKLATNAGLLLKPTDFAGEGVGHIKAPLSMGVATEFWVGSFGIHRAKLYATNASFNVIGIDFLSANDAIIDTGSMNLFLRRSRQQN